MGNGVFSRRSTYRSGVSKLVLLACQDLPQDATHDLAAPRLGQVGHDVHGLGGGEGADALADLDDEVLAQGVGGLVAVLDGHKRVDRLAGELVGNSDDGRLGHGGVLDQGGLDLGRRQSVATNVNDIVDPTADPVKALVISCSTITSELAGRGQPACPTKTSREKKRGERKQK